MFLGFTHFVREEDIETNGKRKRTNFLFNSLKCVTLSSHRQTNIHQAQHAASRLPFRATVSDPQGKVDI